MISAFFIKYKIIIYVVFVAAIISTFSYLYITYTSTMNENKNLQATIVTNNLKIDELTKETIFKQDIITDIRARLITVDEILVKRDATVKIKKETSKKFQEETIKFIAINKESNIKIDTYMIDRYNTILHCIEEVTKDAKDNC